MVNRIIYLVLLLNLVGCSANREQTNLVFQRGNKEAAVGHYREAIAIYQRLEQRGIERAELYCNMGNVYSRSGRPGLARFYYERGLQLAPWDSQLLANRHSVLMQLGIKSAIPMVLDTPGFQHVADRVTTAAIIGLLIGILLLGVNVYSGDLRYSRQLRIAAGTLLTIGTMLIVALLAVSFRTEGNFAIITASNTAVRMGPSEAATQIAEIKEGQKVMVAKQYRGWVKVSISGDLQGWIRTSGTACL